MADPAVVAGPCSVIRLRRWVLWPGLAFLATIGVTAAIARAAAIASGGSTIAPIRSLLPVMVVEDTDLFEAWFASYPALTLMHVVFGCVFLLFAPFQFSSWLRKRHLRLHRWSGRIVAVAAVPTVVSGLLFGAISPFGGPAAASAIGLFGTLFLVSVVQGFAAIRRGDEVRHREWMLRMVSIGAGIATIRVISIPLMLVTGLRPMALIGAAFWLGLGMTFVAAELWIRWTRARAIGSTLESPHERSAL